jgi:uncharacterized protein involved in type VI secretion and phage assembly
MSGLASLTGGSDKSQSGKSSGVSVGIVTNNQDPDKQGRVKLSFPMRNSTDESFWARVSTVMAGKQTGTYFLPEVGSEVLVAFEDGDTEHPIVIGALWNGKDTPPDTNGDGKNNIRTITSRAGHAVTFNDDTDAGKAQLTIKSSAGHSIVLDDTTGSEKISIIDKTGSNKIVFDSSQNNISIECAMQLTIKGNVVQIEGTSSLTLKSGAITTIQGSPVKIN